MEETSSTTESSAVTSVPEETKDKTGHCKPIRGYRDALISKSDVDKKCNGNEIPSALISESDVDKKCNGNEIPSALISKSDVDKKCNGNDIPSCSTDTSRKNKIDNSNGIDELVHDRQLDLCLSSNSVKTGMHSLPNEILLHILSWVVSSDLDMWSLENCAAVSRLWNQCARDPDIWRRACAKFWITNEKNLINYDGSWRSMFIERAKVLTFGLYYSTIYKKPVVDEYGSPFKKRCLKPEPSITDYRYLRFFADGRVWMFISNQTPQNAVQTLNTEEVPSSVYSGQYKLSGNKLFLIFQVDCMNNRLSDDIYSRLKPITRVMVRMVLEIGKDNVSMYDWILYWLHFDMKEIFPRPEEMSLAPLLHKDRDRIPYFTFLPVKCFLNESKSIL